MGRTFFMGILFLTSVFNCLAQEVKFNDVKTLELKEVVDSIDMTKDEIFITAHQMLSEWLPNSNTQSNIDLSDQVTGTIIVKYQYFLGFQKVNPMAGYNCYADVICTIKCKDGKYQVTIKVPTMLLDWSAKSHPAQERVAVEHLFPNFDGYKTKLYSTKKAMMELGPTIPDNMKVLFNSIKSKIIKDDF